MALSQILFITPVSPFGNEFGAQQRSRLLWRALTELGSVDVAVVQQVSAGEIEPPEEGISAQMAWVQRPFGIDKYAPLSDLTKALETKVGRPLTSYDLVVGRYLNPISKLCLPREVPTLVDLDDIGYKYSSGSLWRPKTLVSGGKAWVHKKMVERTLGRFEAYFFVSPRDRSRYGDLKGWVLPNIPYSVPDNPDFSSTGQDILFVGSLWYGPNKEGVERFLARIWPSIQARVPEARFIMAGAATPADRRRWEQVPGVSAPGFVEDLAAAYRAATLVVAPVYSGGGTNIKVVEALGHGRACVTTPFCGVGLAEGFSGQGDLVVAKDETEFADACVRLLQDKASREQVARKGNQVVRQVYSRERFDRTVKEAVDHMLASGRPAPG